MKSPDQSTPVSNAINIKLRTKRHEVEFTRRRKQAAVVVMAVAIIVRTVNI